jgi:hypothetical protein
MLMVLLLAAVALSQWCSLVLCADILVMMDVEALDGVNSLKTSADFRLGISSMGRQRCWL